MGRKTQKVLQLLTNSLDLAKTKKVLKVNPILEINKHQFSSSQLSVFEFDTQHCNYHQQLSVDKLAAISQSQHKLWLNVDIINTSDIKAIAQAFNLHNLIVEDILSINQRPKLDEIDQHIYCIMQMMYYNEIDNSIESEQVSLVLSKQFLLSFQDDANRDHFDATRQKLSISGSKLRQNGLDYLMYVLLDAIVDNYYIVMEKLGEQIEQLEEKISKGIHNRFTMNSINNLRKEMIVFRRNVIPVRDLLNNIIRNDNPLIAVDNKRFYKDVLDHIEQAIDLSNDYKDIITNIRDLYLNQINLRSNEVMKFLAIVTTLLAPATVLGGIFGMNFDRLPWQHNPYGFIFVGALMIGIPILMLMWFKSKGWFE
jgi:magnesium transporter